ncbi:MAG TPA: hypothetical protein VHB77_22310 [Planctomycetaceae bacterium]|nr:hypothetical protein [Planctomycetaceae bacterium]
MSVELPCSHRGPEPFETRLCDLCGIKGQPFDVYSCQLFGECSLQRKHSQVKACAACEKRTPMPAPLPAPKTLPDSARLALERACEAEKFMLAIFRIEDGQVHLERTTVDFPYDDFRTCAELLTSDLLAEIADSTQTETATPKPTRQAKRSRKPQAPK